MIVADILMWFLLIAGTYIVINAYWLTTQGLFPDFVDRCRENIRCAPARPFLLGLAALVPAAIGGIAMFRAVSPILKFAGAALRSMRRDRRPKTQAEFDPHPVATQRQP